MVHKQVLLIHGATAFCRYADFLEYLRTEPIHDPLGLEPRKRWKDSCKEQLTEKGYEVYMPTMPNRQNAKYAEWKLWFERYFTFLRDGVILMGYSQGGYFLAKYLSEEEMPVDLRALYLIAAPFQKDDFGGEDGGDFSFDPALLTNIKDQVEEVHILHSKDDPVVPYGHAVMYHKALPGAELMTFEDKGHFILEEFPEAIESVLGLR